MSLSFQLLLKIGPPVLNQVSPDAFRHFCQTQLSECGRSCASSAQGEGGVCILPLLTESPLEPVAEAS